MEIERELAKQRQKITQFGSGGVHLNTTEKGKARDIVARVAGLSPATFYRGLSKRENQKSLPTVGQASRGWRNWQGVFVLFSLA